MSFPKEHEIYKRRMGRNLGVGLVLAAFIAIVFGLTIVKIGNEARGGAAVQTTGGAE